MVSNDNLVTELPMVVYSMGKGVLYPLMYLTLRANVSMLFLAFVRLSNQSILISPGRYKVNV